MEEKNVAKGETIYFSVDWPTLSSSLQSVSSLCVGTFNVCHPLEMSLQFAGPFMVAPASSGRSYLQFGLLFRGLIGRRLRSEPMNTDARPSDGANPCDGATIRRVIL